MFTYEKNFRSQRPDGRFVSPMASFMETLRHMKAELALPEVLTERSFPEWQEKVSRKMRELLQMPEMTEQPEPKLLGTVKRDTYRVEKWEFYPDDYSAVPFLMLIPDCASPEHPVPGVLCFPGSNHSKEFLSGEEVLDHPNCRCQKYPERNRMALYIVKAGMCAVVFDHLEVGECSLQDASDPGETLWRTRCEYSSGLLQAGTSYLGMTVFQKLCAFRFLKRLPFILPDQWAISSHSLGTECAIASALLLPEIKALVFNDFLSDHRRRYVAITEEEPGKMQQDSGIWHIVPGLMRWFGFQDLCAAFAPRYLALNEGGAEEMLSTVERAYCFCGAEDHLSISFYPAFADPGSRKFHGKLPLSGLTQEEFYEWSYVVASDHSFREKPSIALLKKCFHLK